VNDVMPGTPAEKAGIEEGDVIVEMAGEKISDRSQLQGIVEALEVGEAYDAVVLRDGERQTITVTMEEMPGDFTPAMRRGRPNGETAPDEPETATYDELGLKVEKVTKELAEQLGISADSKGVVVTSVKEGTPAAQIGLEAGDIIEKVGAKRITSPQEFREAVDALSLDSGIALLIRRGDASQFVVLKSE
jgi:serine protease Do